MANKTEFIRIKELTTNGTYFKCATCDNNITELRAMKFPICDECINDLRKIIAERRKPKVVEIGPTIPGGANARHTWLKVERKCRAKAEEYK